mgnify:CR=1 FL=1|jgi:hypothetical protein
MCYHNKNSPWYNIGLKYGFPNIYWSEQVTDYIIATPFNTISNLFYIISGILCLDNYIYGSSVIILGICSGLYHCSVIYPCQLMDISSMTLVFSVMTSQNLNFDIYYTMLMILFYQIFLFCVIKFNLPCQYKSIINIGGVIITTKEFNLNMIITLFFFGIGLYNSYIDLRYKYKYGHTFWHLFTALALYTWNQSNIIINNKLTFESI